ncbi:MAG TPA: hypothetical protein VLZ07_11630, partial [Syntrophales bacterium]|nr:hypothetical protein [Syntrophales bacterium]
RLIRTIEAAAAGTDVKKYGTIESLFRGLRQPRSWEDVAILLASTRVELHHFNLVSLRNLLWDMRTIVILPDSNPETVAKGHILRPRFLSYCDGDFKDVAAVLSRMIGNPDNSNMKIPVSIGTDKKIKSRLSQNRSSSRHTGRKTRTGNRRKSPISL